MVLTADHIPNLKLHVGDNVIVVKDGKDVYGRFRASSDDIVHVEHDIGPGAPYGRRGIRHVRYRFDELDDLYPLAEGGLIRWLDKYARGDGRLVIDALLNLPRRN